ncbi:Imm63 family immunity protein [Kitasatospora sp. NPDC089797]|uniref:Imm63 family immunity protein n=1 Tax=Kitasatospora sp. NPDC089797 TaxID=3155298 RepID=UPI003430DEF9
MGTTARERMQASLETEIERMSSALRLTPYQRPRFGRLEGGAPAMAVGLDGVLHQQYFERGELVFERQTRDPDEFLYWAFEAATQNAAYLWVCDHPGDPGRRHERELARQATLLHALHPHWAERLRDDGLQARRERNDDGVLVAELPPAPLHFDDPEPEDPEPDGPEPEASALQRLVRRLRWRRPPR